MALQVWLPLTKDLRQQGLKNISATIGGTVGLTDVGKLGKCATIGAAAGGITLPASAMTSFTECSVAFWINITSWNTDWDTIFQAGLGSTPWNNYIFGILRNQGNYLCFTVSNGSSTSSGSYASSNLTVGQWMHLAFTYGSGKCKIYINGILDKEYSTSITPNFAGITHIAIGRSTNGSSYQSKCKLNDFRIYDHCLSPMEVKELAKGLVLHYPLNRQGWGQENLVLNSHDLTPASSTTTKNISTRGSSTRQLRSDGFYEAKCTAAWQGLSTWANAQNLVVGQKYTYSFYFYTNGSTKSLSFYPMIYNSSGTRDTSSTLPISVDGGTFTNGNSKPFGTFSNTSPVRHYVIFEWNSTMASIISNGGTIELSIQVHGTFNSGEYGCVYAPKLELGEIMTSWCPNSSDTLATTMGLNGTTEYDCSGFCNNGTRTGTFTWTSDTPKYAVSQVFASGNNYIDCGASQEVLPTDGLTVSLWCKYSTWGNPASCTEGGGWNFENNSGIAFPVYIAGVGYKVASSGITPDTYLNQWHMITGTFDKTNVKIYIDGVLKGTVATGSTNGIGYAANHCYVGAEAAGSNSIASAYFIGSISDFRIYATALSANDIKSLYNNNAYVDASGNVYGQIR